MESKIMNRYLWNGVLIFLLMASTGAAAVLAADVSSAQSPSVVQDANMISLAKAGPLAQIFAAGVVLLLVLMAIVPLVLGNEAGAGINIQ
jgi:hypothetical protein